MRSCAVRTTSDPMTKYGALLLALIPSIANAQPSADPSMQAMSPPMEPPAPQQPQQPAMQVATRATFISTSDDRWDVWIDKQPACATPCSLALAPMQFVVLRSQEQNPIRLDVGYMPQGDVTVSAKPLSSGMYAGGIVMTSFAGMGLATGITLTAVGCSTDHDTMCTAGLITGVASAVGLYSGIYLMRRALPRASIGRAQPYVAGPQIGLAGNF